MRGSFPNRQQIMAELLEESAANKRYRPAAYQPEDGLPITPERDPGPEYPQVALWGEPLYYNETANLAGVMYEWVRPLVVDE